MKDISSAAAVILLLLLSLVTPASINGCTRDQSAPVIVQPVDPADFAVDATDWIRFRGNRGDSRATYEGWELSREQESISVKWRAAVGAGYAAVTVRGNMLYTV